MFGVRIMGVVWMCRGKDIGVGERQETERVGKTGKEKMGMGVGVLYVRLLVYVL